MAKSKSFYTCTQCDAQSPQWLGRCVQCGAWNSFVEGQAVTPATKNKATASGLLDSYTADIQPVEITSVQAVATQRIKTNIDELDRVFGGGIVPGSVVLVGGEPGIGKSTIMLQLAMQLSTTQQVIYVSGEENPEQIKMRAERINTPIKHLKIYPQPNINEVITSLSLQKYPNLLLVVDSIQTVYTPDVDASAGTVNQVKESTARLVRFAKASNTPIIIIGHVTKDGAIAGPKVLEHLVDTVLYLEGERYHDLRILRAVKNRFGAASELGVFEMSDHGLKEIKNPSKIFLEDRIQAPGAVATVVLEGIRPLVLEIQALVTKSFLPMPRRTAQGYDNNRLQMLIAVLQKRLNLPLYEQDVFVNVVGGLRIDEPAADLAVCLAIISSLRNFEIPSLTLAFGEVGLQGEIRHVSKEEMRREEATKLGFTTLITPTQYTSLKDLSQLFKMSSSKQQQDF